MMIAPPVKLQSTLFVRAATLAALPASLQPLTAHHAQETSTLTEILVSRLAHLAPMLTLITFARNVMMDATSAQLNPPTALHAHHLSFSMAKIVWTPALPENTQTKECASHAMEIAQSAKDQPLIALSALPLNS